MLEDDRGSTNGGEHVLNCAKIDATSKESQSIQIRLDKAEEDLPYGKAPELNGIVVLEGACPVPMLFPVDLCFVLDISKSMGTHDRKNRLCSAILASLEKIVDKKVEHRVAIVVFNHEANVLFDLAPLTHTSLKLIEKKLNSLVPFGSTDIGNGLWQGLKTLQDGASSRGSRLCIPALLLFTDGHTNRGVQPQDLIPQLKEVSGLDGLVIHTFGMGLEHNSWLAHGIAVMYKGLYFFVADDDELFVDKILEVLHDLTSNHLRNISVRLEAQKGARVTLVATPYTVKTLQPAKLYEVNVGNLQLGEVKTILLKFSLRRMPERMPQHHLMKVTVTYQEAHGRINQASEDISVSRMKRKGKTSKRSASNHPRLHNYINKYTFALALQKALRYATNGEYTAATKELAIVIDMILKTPFAEASALLIKDIKKCQEYLKNTSSFSINQYAAYSMLTRYLMKTELCPIMQSETNKNPLTLSSATDIGNASPISRSMNYVEDVLQHAA